MSAFAVRAVTLFSLFLFGPFTFWAYVICIFVFEPDPHVTPSSRQEKRARRKQRRAERRARRKTRKSYANEDYEQFAEEVANEAYVEIKAAFQESARQDEVDEDEFDKAEEDDSATVYSRDKCTEIYNTMELRLREIEAFMTSKRFRLHCEINRI